MAQFIITYDVRTNPVMTINRYTMNSQLYARLIYKILFGCCRLARQRVSLEKPSNGTCIATTHCV
jgi:hypothetical protein